LSRPLAGGGRRRRPTSRARHGKRLGLERLEDRTAPSVTIAPTNNNGNGYTGLDFNQSTDFGEPPDTNGAAGPSNYVEAVNSTVAIYSPKATGASHVSAGFSTFFASLPAADSGAFFTDCSVLYDDNIPGGTPTTGRFLVTDENVDPSTGKSVFDIAVSKSASPATLTASDWNFYQLTTGEAGGIAADYPGNLGYNQDALVVTFNMFNTSGFFQHVEVDSVNMTDLVNGVPQNQLHSFRTDLTNGDFGLRPATEHNAAANAPLWLVSETGDGAHINVYKETNVLSTTPTFTLTQLAVNPYTDTQSVPPRQPNGTVVTGQTDSRMEKAALEGNTLVATHPVALSSTQDAAQWYQIDVSSGTPVLSQQGDVSLGNNTYAYYPAIDINPAGQIGMTFMDSGTGAGQFMSMWVTGRTPTDASGTMETPVEVPAGTGQANYTGTRAGDLGGINVDPSDGSFWAANEFANQEALNWGTAIANFTVGTNADQWTGANHLVDNNWSDGANWSLGHAPGAGDTALFTNNAQTQSFTANVDAAFTIKALILDSSWGGTINLNQNQSLTVTGNATMASGTVGGAGSLSIGSGGSQLSGGNLNPGTGSITSGGVLAWSGGTLSPGAGGFTNSGTINLVNSAVVGLDTGTLTNQGVINQSGSANLQIQNGATLVNTASGTYDFTTNTGIQQSGGTDTFSNAGLLEKTAGAGTSTISTTFVNSNKITVQKGTLALAAAGGTSTGGAFSVSGGATLDLTGGNTVTYGGSYTGSGAGAVLLGSGTLAAAAGGATFNMSGSLFQWKGGTIDVSAGNFTNAGTLTLSNSGTVALNGTGAGAGQLINTKSIIQNGAGNLQIQNGATLTNKGTYDIQANSGIQASGGTDTFTNTNTGTLKKSKGTGTTTVASLLNNTGTVQVQTGTLSLSGTVTQVSGNTLTAGTWNVNSTATVPATLNITSAGTLTTIGTAAKVTLNGGNSTFSNLSGLNSILAGGSFSLLGNQSFTTSGALTNAGSITLSPGSTLTVVGSFTQTSAGKQTLQMGNVSGTPHVGSIVSTSGTVTLAGKLTVTSTVVPSVGTAFDILNNQGGAAIAGTFVNEPEGSTFTVKVGATTMTFQITYKGGGTGHDVVITRTS
jgi:hypothetical protein